MEEPLANMITLQYLSQFNTDKPYLFARDFIVNKQPDQYKLGATLYDLGIHEWWLWRSKKSLLSNKREDERKDWFNLGSEFIKQGATETTGKHAQAFCACWWSLMCPETDATSDAVQSTYQPGNLTGTYNSLVNAITTSDVNSIRSILNTTDIDRGIENRDGMTLLHSALGSSNLEVAQLLFADSSKTVKRLFPTIDDIRLISGHHARQFQQWLSHDLVRWYKGRRAFGNFS